MQEILIRITTLPCFSWDLSSTQEEKRITGTCTLEQNRDNEEIGIKDFNTNVERI